MPPTPNPLPPRGEGVIRGGDALLLALPSPQLCLTACYNKRKAPCCFDSKELVARVKAHTARYERLIGSTQKANDIIEIRGLKIDKTARRVYINGEEKNFTTKEFDLLAFLASNPNHVYTKDELFREIWGMESIGDIATVTVHIKKIREKVELDTSNPQYIETIWGVGYRFKA